MSEITLKQHLSRIGKIGTGKAKRRPKEQYVAMGKARWKKYYADKKLLAKAVLQGFCKSGVE